MKLEFQDTINYLNPFLVVKILNTVSRNWRQTKQGIGSDFI